MQATGSTVQLNVGGHPVTTTEETLTKCQYFARLLANRGDNTDPIFVDAEWPEFKPILEYLRHGALPDQVSNATVSLAQFMLLDGFGAKKTLGQTFIRRRWVICGSQAYNNLRDGLVETLKQTYGKTDINEVNGINRQHYTCTSFYQMMGFEWQDRDVKVSDIAGEYHIVALEPVTYVDQELADFFNTTVNTPIPGIRRQIVQQLRKYGSVHGLLDNDQCNLDEYLSGLIPGFDGPLVLVDDDDGQLYRHFQIHFRDAYVYL